MKLENISDQQIFIVTTLKKLSEVDKKTLLSLALAQDATLHTRQFLNVLDRLVADDFVDHDRGYYSIDS